MRKTILQKSCSVQKSAPKNTKYSKRGKILKIGHVAKAIAFFKMGQKLKMSKNMWKTFLPEH